MVTKLPFSTPDLILKIFHSLNMESMPVNMLIKVADYMGVSENVIRVSLCRLVQRNRIEINTDGEYRLVSSHSAIDHHSIQWRLGEKRRVGWDENWVVCDLLKPSPTEPIRHRSLWALDILGFKKNPNGLFLRPNNLAGGMKVLTRKLNDFGLEFGAELFIGSSFSEKTEQYFKTQLWPIKELDKTYLSLIKKIKKYHLLIQKDTSQQVLMDAFMLGHKATRVLIRDPLLPEIMQDSSDRVELTRLMLEYEMLGKRLWEGAIPGLKLN